MDIRTIYTICGITAKTFFVELYGPNSVYMDWGEDFTRLAVNVREKHSF